MSFKEYINHVFRRKEGKADLIQKIIDEANQPRALHDDQLEAAGRAVYQRIQQAQMRAKWDAQYARNTAPFAVSGGLQGARVEAVITDDYGPPPLPVNPTGFTDEMVVDFGSEFGADRKLTDALADGWVIATVKPHPSGFSSFVLRRSVIRSKATLNAAKDQSCVNCGKADGTVVACHYQGIRANDFGRGKGVKASDLAVADLCSTCHTEFDNYEGSAFSDPFMRKIDLSERFMYCVMMTQLRRFDQGVLAFSDQKEES